MSLKNKCFIAFIPLNRIKLNYRQIVEQGKRGLKPFKQSVDSQEKHAVATLYQDQMNLS